MKVLFRYTVLAAVLSTAAFGQVAPPPQTSGPFPASLAGSPLSQDQIREIVRQSADKDMENQKKQRDYTYIERQVMRRLDGKGHVKSTESETYDVMEIYGEQVQKLIAKNDKPLSAKDAKKQDDKIQKLIDKRRKESAADREKRLKAEEKDREDSRKFVLEVADAYNFRYAGMEAIDGRDNYVIDAEPKPGYKARMKEAKILPKFRFRAWIDKDSMEWRKLDVQCIGTVSLGLFLVRLHPGSRIVVEQTRVNNEVWLQQHVVVDADFRLALLKNFDLAVDVTDSDYKKFRTDTRILPVGEARPEP